MVNGQIFWWCIIGVNDTWDACSTGVIDTGKDCITDITNIGEFVDHYLLVSMIPAKYDLTGINTNNACIDSVIGMGEVRWIPNFSDTALLDAKLIRYRTFQYLVFWIPNFSDTEFFRYWTFPIPNFSGTKLFSYHYWIFQIPNFSDSEFSDTKLVLNSMWGTLIHKTIPPQVC
jgi:hypothetical protein